MLPLFDFLSKALMNRTCRSPHPLPGWSSRPRLLVLAVLAAVPGVLQAQTVSPVPGTSQSGPVVAPAKPRSAASIRAAEVLLPLANPVAPRDPRATQIEAGRIDGRDQVDMTAVDNVRLERGNMVMTSDRLYYDQVANEVQAQGNVRLVRGADLIEGPRAHMNLDTWFGEFESPTYQLQRERRLSVDSWPTTGRPAKPLTQLVSGSGKADLLQLEGENHYRLTNSTYTTCPAPDPSWYLRMSDLELDFDRDKGEATHSRLIFKGVPIAYMPWAEFPLSGGRQSGFLPMTVGATNSTGFDTTVPYYFNIAPNYDATLAPRWMSERGLQVGGEARYLTPVSSGSLRGEYLSEDKILQTSRSLYSWKHNQDFGRGLSAAVDAAQVSDKTYFADMSSKIGTTSQSSLNQQASLNYNSGSWLSAGVLAQRYQVLSGAAPYSRMPQVTALAGLADYHGMSLKMPFEYTDFAHPTLDEGRRTTIYPQIAYPMQSSAFYLTPKVGMHMSRYNVSRHGTEGEASSGRNVPSLALDTGVVFERNTTSGGRDQIQTLEPRVYYVRTAFRDQNELPVFDTGLADFNFAQIFSENRYSGQDRIADANQITGGLQSRMIDSASGEEWLRTALAQRYYFTDQRVTLPGETRRSGRVANVLGAVSGRASRDVWIDNAVEYDPRVKQWQRATTGLRYQPDFSKVASISYRYQRDQFRDLDVSALWPLWGNWYGVGRYNLNMRDHRLTEAIGGLEYKGDCWVLRAVWQTLLTTEQTNGQTRNNSVFLQLEFNGLASLGSNPVNLLKRSVNGYGKINEPGVGDPMFGDATQP